MQFTQFTFQQVELIDDEHKISSYKDPSYEHPNANSENRKFS